MSRRRIGIFIDGAFFMKAISHFKKQHPIRAALTPVGIIEYSQKVVAEYENRNESDYDVIHRWWFQGKMDYGENQQFNGEKKKLREEYLEEQNELETLLEFGNINWCKTPAFINPEGEIISPTTKVALAIKAFELSVYGDIDIMVLVTNSYELIPMVERVQARTIPVVQVSFILGKDVKSGNGLGKVCSHAAYINSGTPINPTISEDKNIQRLFDITLFPKQHWGEPTIEIPNPFPKTLILPSKLNNDVDEDPF